jgi:hypothetical protein
VTAHLDQCHRPLVEGPERETLREMIPRVP